MNDLQTALVQVIANSRQGVHRYLVGFDEGNRTAQGPSLPNHAAWTLGHCALTMHEVAGRLDAGPLPDADFVHGRTGDERRFATEAVAFGSTPSPDAALYPTLARCIGIFDHACDRFSNGASGASAAALEQSTPWAGSAMPLWHLVIRVSQHNAMHAGQLIDLRRALGMKRIFS
ncbi:MAG TPA: hypothetical protein DEB06_09135 [Phycisphaerales bacterium]|nr:hypothetical protein [Phycisphaerales bacterium]